LVQSQAAVPGGRISNSTTSPSATVVRHKRRPMRRFTFILFLFLFTSCTSKKSNIQTLDFGLFKIKTPIGWKSFKKQGIDSYVGGLSNGKDSLYFDLGWYSPEIKDEDIKKHLYGQDTINGHIAIIQIPKVDGEGSIILSIPKINEKD
jgi:hypothetical protein